MEAKPAQADGFTVSASIAMTRSGSASLAGRASDGVLPLPSLTRPANSSLPHHHAVRPDGYGQVGQFDTGAEVAAGESGGGGEDGGSGVAALVLTGGKGAGSAGRELAGLTAAGEGVTADTCVVAVPFLSKPAMHTTSPRPTMNPNLASLGIIPLCPLPPVVGPDPSQL